MLAADAGYDGIFVTAVKTTGIFCRPSCRAKKPRVENVEFFPAARDALLAGYRPCRRCRPMDTNGRPPAWVERLLEAGERRIDERMRDRDLRALGIEPVQARRYFNTHYGMTFQAYHRARRLGRAMAVLREGAHVTSTALSTGYASDSGFREAFEKLFGDAPTRRRAKSEACIVAAMIENPVGPLLVGATETALCLLEFCDRRAIEKQISTWRGRFDAPVVPGTNRVLKQAIRELNEYFAGGRKTFDVPLHYPGTPFQMEVWRALLKIPYGQTISYAELARRVGRPDAQRAVGTANGCNRIAIVIPCHRVVNKDGRLGGYGGGLWRKQILLDLERGQRTI